MGLIQILSRISLVSVSAQELFSAAWMSAKLQNTKQKLHFLSFTAIKTSTIGSHYQSIL